MEEIDPKDLPKFNGKDGNPVYIVYKDRVIDVSASPRWKTGLHMNLHHAGNDLTTNIQSAPHGLEVLDRYPQVGVLKKEKIFQREIPEFLTRLLERYPILKRHPHPMTIHFPIVFMIAAPFFAILYLLTGFQGFEITALSCLGAGVLFSPVAIGTGFYTWWLNYQARPMRAVRIKQRVSITMFFLALIVFIWRLIVPDILLSFRVASGFYLVLVLSLMPLVSIIGWFGAQLTFPVERE